MATVIHTTAIFHLESRWLGHILRSWACDTQGRTESIVSQKYRLLLHIEIQFSDQFYIGDGGLSCHALLQRCNQI